MDKLTVDRHEVLEMLVRAGGHLLGSLMSDARKELASSMEADDLVRWQRPADGVANDRHGKDDWTLLITGRGRAAFARFGQTDNEHDLAVPRAA